MDSAAEHRYTAHDQPLPKGSSPIAVLVCHGMGQQAPFETLNDVADAIRDEHLERGWKMVNRTCERMKPEDADPRTVDFIPSPGNPVELLPIAEVTLEKGGQQQEFHFFEAYWAPLTEGVVRLDDVLLYLLKAAWDGFFASLKGNFARFAFGKKQTYAISRLTAAQLLIAFLTVVSLILLAISFIAVLAGDAASHSGFQLSPVTLAIVESLHAQLGPFLVCVALSLVIPLAGVLVGKLSGEGHTQLIRMAGFLSVIPVFAGIVWFGAAVIASWWSRGQSNWMAGTPLPEVDLPLPVWMNYMLFATAGVFVIVIANYFLVKYMGDVTAYVSANAVNRFWKVRQNIQATVLDVARGVYGRRGANKLDPLYHAVVVISHSLGTVVAYDTLNALVALEESGTDRTLDNVAQRTRLLLTCGSPLNKIAFLFRYQASGTKLPEWRELLNNYRQPMMLNHCYRPRRWINIWSYPDWISGRLTYFEKPDSVEEGDLKVWIRAKAGPKGPPTDLRIDNRVDAQAIIPLYEHTTYFKHKEFRRSVYEGIWE